MSTNFNAKTQMPAHAVARTIERYPVARDLSQPSLLLHPIKSYEDDARIYSLDQFRAGKAIYQFAVGYIPSEHIEANPDGDRSLKVAATIAAGNWLRTTPEEAGDNQLMADVVLGIFGAIPARQLRVAGFTFQALREQHGPGKRDFDTTHRLTTLFRGLAPLEPGSTGRVETRLRDDQVDFASIILERYPKPALEPPVAALSPQGGIRYVR